MRILGIETSCDETAAAVVVDGCRVESSVISSSREIFAHAGGVIPEDAARRQMAFMIPVIHKALTSAGADIRQIDAIAVTHGPGLLGSLLVGTTAARTMASVHGLRMICVHHTFGHLTSPWLDAVDPLPKFPCITLSASGGHTDIWLRTSHTEGKLLGTTRDDAAGEAFDKGAALLGLPYPGGPSVAKTAESGDPHAFDFPMALRGEDTLDFSFSGIKTSLRYMLRDMTVPIADVLCDVAASYQHGICKQLADRVQKAIDAHPACKEVHLVGGVSANEHLRSLLTGLPIPVRTPAKLSYCTDNAAMIAAAGYFLHKEKPNEALSDRKTSASAPLSEAVSIVPPK